MRITVEIPEAQLQPLAEVCRQQKISRAEAIRRAVAEYAGRRAAHWGASAFGLWRARRTDGLDYERRLRREW